MMRREEELKSLLDDKPTAVNFYETTDDVGRFVLNKLVSPLEVDSEGCLKFYLPAPVFLKATNHSSLARAVVGALSDYKIGFDNVVVFNTDNAAYMRKTYQDVLRGLFPGAVRVTCMAHILNLFGESLRKPFTEVDKFLKVFNAMFGNATARKGRYLRHMMRGRREERPKMVPNPIVSRWNSWCEAVAYHKEPLSVYRAFVREKVAHYKSQVSESLSTVDTLLDEKYLPPLMADSDMSCIQAKSSMLVELTDMFQSQKPMAIKVWTALEDLEFMFTSEEDTEEFLNGLNDVDKDGSR